MTKQKFKLLNGLCVPVSTPDNYFEMDAERWLRNLGELVKAGHSLEQLGRELAEARIEYEAEG